MKKFLTDVHTHSDFSFDSDTKLEDMLQTALRKGMAFYGVSEHFDFDQTVILGDSKVSTDGEAYFHAARHLQEDYAGCLNVLVGAEFGYTENKEADAMYEMTVKKYAPDFIVNSVHTLNGLDYYHKQPFYRKGVLLEKETAYREYLQFVRRSLDTPDYEYDILGHLGYATRYAPYEDKRMPYAQFAEDFDDILLTVIRKNKILEVNCSGGMNALLPQREIIERYFALGGRKVSYASDAHSVEKIGYCREEAMQMLKEIGFTYLTVPCKGEHIKVEI